MSIQTITNIYSQLIIGITIGIAVYVGGACLFKFSEQQELLTIIKRK